MLSKKIKQLRNSKNDSVYVNEQSTMSLFNEMIKKELNNDSIPTSLSGLQELAREKNKTLNSLLSINLSKKERKAVDFLCEYRFDINGGYQGFKNKVNTVKNDLLKNFELFESTLPPEQMIVCYDPDNNTMYDISEMDVEFTIFKYSGFSRYPQASHGCAEELNEDGFIELSQEQCDLIQTFYSVSDLFVDCGTDDDSFGFGNMDKDIQYVQDYMGLNPNDNSFDNFDYFQFNGNDRPLIIMVIARPTDDKIQNIKSDIINYQ